DLAPIKIEGDHGMILDEATAGIELLDDRGRIDRRFGREVKIVRKPRVREIGFSEAVAALQDERVPQFGGVVKGDEEPAEDVIALNVRDVNAELAGLLLYLFAGDHGRLPR